MNSIIKTTMNKRILGLSMLVAAGATALTLSTVPTKRASMVRAAYASEEPLVIEIKAKKFEFSPSAITLKKGEPVILRLTSEDRKHGFFLRPLKIDADITPGKTTDVAITPDTAGDYTVICDHYCGTGHGNMKMKLTVTQ